MSTIDVLLAPSPSTGSCGGDALGLNNTEPHLTDANGPLLGAIDVLKPAYPVSPKEPFGSYGNVIDSDLDKIHNTFLPSLNPDFNASLDRLTQHDGLELRDPSSPKHSRHEEPTQQKPKRQRNRKKTVTGPGAQRGIKIQRQTERAVVEPDIDDTRTDEIKGVSRRARSLERNRVAASKCRKRKKIWTEKLEEKKSHLEATNRELHAQCIDLLQETSNLKNYLICHAGCNDANIDVWIGNEASKYAKKLRGISQHQFAYRQGVPGSDVDASWHSSSNSQRTGPSEDSPGFGHDESNDEIGEDHDDELFQVPSSSQEEEA